MRKKFGNHEGTWEENNRSVEWMTPPQIIKSLGDFDLDPCASEECQWKTADRQYTIDDDGLTQKWEGRVWLNPPYGKKTEKWLKKMKEHNNGIVLIFARTETKMYFDHVWENANGIRFLKRRIKFLKPNGTIIGSSGAPSVLISYDNTEEKQNYNSLINCDLEGKFLPIT